jgi:hypothetical protein
VAPLEFQSSQVQTPPLPPYQVREPALLNNVSETSAAAAAARTTRNRNMAFMKPHSDLIPSLSLSNYSAERQEAAGSHQETGLLRHYRYKIAPWIDIGNPESPFGIKIMLAAREHKPLFASILALAARHESLILFRQTTNDIDHALEHHQRAEEGLNVAEDHIKRAGSLLLILGDFLSSSPQRWRAMLLHHLGNPGALSSLEGLRHELDEHFFWLFFRIGELVLYDMYCRLSTPNTDIGSQISLRQFQPLVHRSSLSLRAYA